MVTRINLALQGGGAHGAFTWGVLDRILADPEIEIAGISGTSAGALNGAALKAGLASGGREAARENLDWLWGRIGALDTTFLPAWLQTLLPDPGTLSRSLEYSPPYVWGEAVSRMMSPYAWGPFYENPLARIVADLRFDDVCSSEGPRLFICATQVRSGKVRIFSGDKISDAAILASACLPTLFQAVDCIDPESGEVEAFWDGGYTGNPALFPLFDKTLPDDVVIININPLNRDRVPVTPQEIQNRINEISFNSSLMRELRAIEFVQRLIASGAVSKGAMKDVRVHMIADDVLMNQLSVATKLVPLPTVIADLKQAGQAAAEAFLEQHKCQLGVEQSAALRRIID